MTAGQETEDILGRLAEGATLEPGEDFFPKLVRGVAETPRTYRAWVTEYLPGPRRLRAHAFWLGQRFVNLG